MSTIWNERHILNLKPQVRFADKQVCHKVAEQH